MVLFLKIIFWYIIPFCCFIPSLCHSIRPLYEEVPMLLLVHVACRYLLHIMGDNISQYQAKAGATIKKAALVTIALLAIALWIYYVGGDIWIEVYLQYIIIAMLVLLIILVPVAIYLHRGNTLEIDQYALPWEKSFTHAMEWIYKHALGCFIASLVTVVACCAVSIIAKNMQLEFIVRTQSIWGLIAPLSSLLIALSLSTMYKKMEPQAWHLFLYPHRRIFEYCLIVICIYNNLFS